MVGEHHKGEMMDVNTLDQVAGHRGGSVEIKRWKSTEWNKFRNSA